MNTDSRTVVFLGNGRCYHTLDWFRSAQRLSPATPPVFVTDLIEGESFHRLLRAEDIVHPLYVIDGMLPRPTVPWRETFWRKHRQARCATASGSPTTQGIAALSRSRTRARTLDVLHRSRPTSCLPICRYSPRQRGPSTAPAVARVSHVCPSRSAQRLTDHGRLVRNARLRSKTCWGAPRGSFKMGSTWAPSPRSKRPGTTHETRACRVASRIHRKTIE